MKIGVIGLGFVGSAVYDYFHKIYGSEVKGYDKFKYIGTLGDVLDSEYCFLCLPSLTREDGTQDLEALHETLYKLNQQDYSGIIIIKSTVLPGTCRKWIDLYPDLRICHNPEFLTARTAVEDFKNQQIIILGAEETQILSDVASLYEECFPDCIIINGTQDESELCKYMCNCFFATKVALFNEFYQVAQRMGINYKNARHMALLATPWMCEQHTKVPGPDGSLGFGGACFPKDTKALLHFMQNMNVPCETLKGARLSNDKIRKE